MSTERTEPPSVDNLAEARRAIEAVLLVATDPTPVQLLAQLIELPVDLIQAMCEELAAEYEAERRGFQLVEVAGGWRYQTHPDTHAYVERFALEGIPNRLSSAALETLAIVAYKQPISRGQIGAIRGVNVDGVLRTLVQRGYVDEQGRDEGPGQATLFGTTSFFLEQLGLMSLDDLPALGDFVPSAEVLEALEQTLRVDGQPEPDPEVIVLPDEGSAPETEGGPPTNGNGNGHGPPAVNGNGAHEAAGNGTGPAGGNGVVTAEGGGAATIEATREADVADGTNGATDPAEAAVEREDTDVDIDLSDDEPTVDLTDRPASDEVDEEELDEAAIDAVVFEVVSRPTEVVPTADPAAEAALDVEIEDEAEDAVESATVAEPEISGSPDPEPGQEPDPEPGPEADEAVDGVPSGPGHEPEVAAGPEVEQTPGPITTGAAGVDDARFRWPDRAPGTAERLDPAEPTGPGDLTGPGPGDDAPTPAPDRPAGLDTDDAPETADSDDSDDSAGADDEASGAAEAVDEPGDGLGHRAAGTVDRPGRADPAHRSDPTAEGAGPVTNGHVGAPETGDA